MVKKEKKSKFKNIRESDFKDLNDFVLKVSVGYNFYLYDDIDSAKTREKLKHEKITYVVEDLKRKASNKDNIYIYKGWVQPYYDKHRYIDGGILFNIHAKNLTNLKKSLSKTKW